MRINTSRVDKLQTKHCYLTFLYAIRTLSLSCLNETSKHPLIIAENDLVTLFVDIGYLWQHYQLSRCMEVVHQDLGKVFHRPEKTTQEVAITFK